VPVQRGEFHFIGMAIAVNMDDGSHIASLQSFCGDWSGKDDSFVFFDHDRGLFLVRICGD
jgi:hypothetical protein